MLLLLLLLLLANPPHWLGKNLLDSSKTFQIRCGKCTRRGSSLLNQTTTIATQKSLSVFQGIPIGFGGTILNQSLFTCPHEFRFGKLGDGGKWVCDPHRILADNKEEEDAKSESSCLVYSIGSNGNFQFEEETFKHVSPSCEIHTFDLVMDNRGKNFADEAKKTGVSFHHWGLGKKTKNMLRMKTFKEMMIELKHEQRTVDLMKIDCERCEYDQF